MKNTILKSFGILFLCLWMTGCESNAENDELLIKIKNISNYDYHEVLVNTSGGEQLYGTVPSKEESEYKTFDSAYRYAYVEAVIQGKKYIIQPIDYVGEQLLDPGKYTYVIDANDETSQFGRLIMHLEAE